MCYPSSMCSMIFFLRHDVDDVKAMMMMMMITTINIFTKSVLFKSTANSKRNDAWHVTRDVDLWRSSQESFNYLCSTIPLYRSIIVKPQNSNNAEVIKILSTLQSIADVAIMKRNKDNRTGSIDRETIRPERVIAQVGQMKLSAEAFPMLGVRFTAHWFL